MLIENRENNQRQGCQLLDFSLRPQTFCYTADFSTTFYICLKPRLFAHPITKPPASTLEFKDFDFIWQKNSVNSDKNGKSASTQLAPPVPGRPMVCGLREVSRLF